MTVRKIPGSVTRINFSDLKPGNRYTLDLGNGITYLDEMTRWYVQGESQPEPSPYVDLTTVIRWVAPAEEVQTTPLTVRVDKALRNTTVLIGGRKLTVLRTSKLLRQTTVWFLAPETDEVFSETYSNAALPIVHVAS